MSESSEMAGPTPTGILVIDKPMGWTSMDVCARVRARLRRGGAPKRIKVGHGGTLDPMATGVLVVLVGKATPLCERIMEGRKWYRAEIDFSRRSTTDDREGELTVVEVASPPSESAVRAATMGFVGRIMQRPPDFSAIHIGGKRAYDLARAGREVVIAPRPVDVYRFEILTYDWPRACVEIECGKGTYIRSLARDLGVALGAGGMLTALRRTRVGRFGIEDSIRLENLPDPMTGADLAAIPAELAQA